MYTLPPTIDLIPDMSLESAALTSELSLVVSIWLAVAMLLLLVIVPLARRPGVPTAPAQVERLDPSLSRAV
jgi:hypothetical protein